jgi:hypothetical protein
VLLEFDTPLVVPLSPLSVAEDDDWERSKTRNFFSAPPVARI